MPTTFELNCYVLGDNVNSIFQVKIEDTESVGTLRKAIKDKKTPAFNHVDPDSLVLRRVSVLVDASFDTNVRLAVDNESPLFPLDRLSEVFSNSPAPKYLHIVVESPPVAIQHLQLPQVLHLNCYVVGDDPSRIFVVKIEDTESVGTLRKAIKEKKTPAFNHVDACSLVLRRVSILADASFDTNVRLAADNESPLLPLEQLSEVFSAPNQPHPRRLQVIIQLPQGRLKRDRSPSETREDKVLKRRRRCIQDMPSGSTPSSQANPSTFFRLQSERVDTEGNPLFYCNRPSSNSSIPVTLLHPIFGEFVDDCNRHPPTKEDNAFIHELSVLMALPYRHESRRATTFRGVLSRHYGITLRAAYIHDTSHPTAGHCVAGPLSYPYIITEAKNEIGAAGADPLLQGAFDYMEFLRKTALSAPKSVLPCIHVFYAGPYIGFAGSAFTDDKIHLDVLTPVIPLFWNRYDTSLREMTARIFGALKKATTKLTTYYEKELPGIQMTAIDQSSLSFPYKSGYRSLSDEAVIEIKYDFQLVPDKLLFFGHNGDGNKEICIKFTRSYSKEAHQYCASLGHAPQLLGYEILPGGWHFVVMDVIDFEAYRSYSKKEEYGALLPSAAYLRPRFEDFIHRLHERNFVHGDIRDTNLWVTISGDIRFMLVDFDWAGTVGEVRYPANVNITSVKRPHGAWDGELIEIEHDLQMMTYMFDAAA